MTCWLPVTVPAASARHSRSTSRHTLLEPVTPGFAEDTVQSPSSPRSLGKFHRRPQVLREAAGAMPRCTARGRPPPGPWGLGASPGAPLRCPRCPGRLPRELAQVPRRAPPQDVSAPRPSGSDLGSGFRPLPSPQGPASSAGSRPAAAPSAGTAPKPTPPGRSWRSTAALPEWGSLLASPAAELRRCPAELLETALLCAADSAKRCGCTHGRGAL